MELTIENLISFIKKERYEDNEILPQNTLLTDLGIDGDDAVELLMNLQKNFNVSFESFNFNKYFYREGFSLFSFSTIFKTLLGKPREIKPELTIQELYDYMITAPSLLTK
ncbi:DUF1493 family protein [Chryseobacterium echinoideorum]|uniref:DUF1493 family protein n=1 Tax=Chryseobacterium echinoideorum TaxID=1549648 RepID=UPI0011852AD5|nr:DUF1493 family protein [Chryseobacterium echinoideorum]